MAKYKLHLLLFLLTWLCNGQTTVSGNTTKITGKVISITDGDTFKLLLNDSTVQRIRIANIDCPEKKQPYSQRAKQFTSNAIFGKKVNVEVLNIDRYGRLIGIVVYDNAFNLNHELVKQGLAWHYVKYSNDTTLQRLEDNAKMTKLGLWQDPNAIPPWDWRNQKRKKVKQ
ncbi:endonuclease YncB(thermonuclease family) [Flavobacteriaceae bacterium MAR_2010_105]|nr:endonuclease YncB(thermonuclease family) [Flavobacteriaceae bacterium MAR_2010_105]